MLHTYVRIINLLLLINTIFQVKRYVVYTTVQLSCKVTTASVLLLRNLHEPHVCLMSDSQCTPLCVAMYISAPLPFDWLCSRQSRVVMCHHHFVKLKLSIMEHGTLVITIVLSTC